MADKRRYLTYAEERRLEGALRDHMQELKYISNILYAVDDLCRWAQVPDLAPHHIRNFVHRAGLTPFWTPHARHMQKTTPPAALACAQEQPAVLFPGAPMIMNTKSTGVVIGNAYLNENQRSALCRWCNNNSHVWKRDGWSLVNAIQQATKDLGTRIDRTAMLSALRVTGRISLLPTEPAAPPVLEEHTDAPSTHAAALVAKQVLDRTPTLTPEPEPIRPPAPAASPDNAWAKFSAISEMIGQQKEAVETAKGMLLEEERKLTKLVEERKAMRNKLQELLLAE